MAVLVHEVWEEPDGCTMLCLAGADGEGARRLLEPGSRLVWSILAGSHFQAMTLYYALMGWGPYVTSFEQDSEPYPDEWARAQRK